MRVRVVAYKTYKQYAKKYNIPLRRHRKLKSIKSLSNQIYRYEKRNKIYKNGLYSSWLNKWCI